MNLEQEVTDARREIKSDAYPMSIGELVNIYRDGELDIHPEFQRTFRWSSSQRSKLIESILMGIPIPSIFVSQRKDGVWDVVDGVQRISTILEFLGYLKDEDGNLLSPLVLEKTSYLPSLEGIGWKEDGSTKKLPDPLKLAFKREKIDLKIILKESDGDAKYELFQRLNTGGTRLSDQEVRNCLLIMLNRKAYDLLVNVSADENYKESLCLNKRNLMEKYEMELVLRFLISRRLDDNLIIDESNISPYITEQMKRLLVSEDFDFDQEETHQKIVFKVLNEALGDNAFKKYNHNKEKYTGAFSVPVFEVMTTGVSHYLIDGNDFDESVTKAKLVSKALTLDEDFREATTHGSRPVDRFPKSISIAKKLFR